MIKNKLIITIVIVLLIIMFLDILSKNNTFENEITEQENENVISDVKESITIYDIEDGYLTVSYNPKVRTHDYNWECLNYNNGLYNYEDKNYKTKLGIDVSEYQGDIDWKEVKQSGIEFAFIRLGFRGYGDAGRIVLDSKFEQNYNNAKNEGIEIGVYFFSQSISMKEIEEEANFILEHLKDKEISYPVVFDLEKIKNNNARTDNLTIDDITNLTLEFCRIIKENNYVPSIYGNAKTFTTRMKLEELNDYNKWYADYQEKPLFPYEFNIWQYTESGKVNGISTLVDINIDFVRKTF